MRRKYTDPGNRLIGMAGPITILAVVLSLALPALGEQEEPIIHRIRLEGNNSFKAGLLKNQMRKFEGQPDDSVQIITDAQNILSFYRKNGYLDVELLEVRRSPSPGEPHLMTYTIVVYESDPYIISQINIEGATKFKEEKLRELLVIKPGEVLRTAFIDYSEYLLQESYNRSGYIYCKIDSKLEPAPYARRARTLTFTIDEGQQVRIGTVTVDSNVTVRTRIIEREIIVRPGEIYNPSMAYESQKKIYGTGLFEEVWFREIGTAEKSEVIDLAFYVREGKPRWVAFGGGFQQPDKVNVYLQWGHDNIFNNGQKLKLEASFATNRHWEHTEHFGVSHREPYLFSSSFKGELRLFHDREHRDAYDILESGGNVRVGRYIGKRIEAFVQYQFKTSSTEIYMPEEPIPEPDGVTNSISLSLTRDNRDNIFDPRRGTLSSLRGDVAGGVLGGDYSFYRYIGDVSVFYNPLRDIVFAARARGGAVKPLGSQGVVPLGERFPLRGSDAVRGYAEEDLTEGGYYLTTFNVEMRFPVFRMFNKYFGFAYFVDMGNSFRPLLRLEDILKDMRIGAGAGIRFETPIGPFRLDYARNITGESDTDYGRFYFAIGHMF
jgi:outer membrane protein assembly complex protein YaeT